MSQASVTNISLQIIFLRFYWNLPGANEVTLFSFIRLKLNCMFCEACLDAFVEVYVDISLKVWPDVYEDIIKILHHCFWLLYQFPSFIMAIIPLLLFLFSFLYIIKLIMLHFFRIFALFSVKLSK